MNANNESKNGGQKNVDGNGVRVIEEIVEGVWDCPNCNAKNRGSAQQCDACGAVRSENVKFYVEDDAKAITDEAELAKANAGPDWICPFCSNMSPASSTRCTGCGSDRSVGKNRAVKEIPPDSGETPAMGGKKGPPGPVQPAPLWLKAGCGVIALLFLILSFLSCHEKALKIEITANQWVRQIERAEYKTVREDAWANEVPSGARKFSSERQIRSHKEIPDGFEEVSEDYTEKVKIGEKKVEDGKVDLGNGRFKAKYKMVPEYKEEKRTRRVKRQKFRKEPVYDEKVTYDIDRWVPFASIELQGTTDEPRWPDSGASNNVPPALGDLTEKARIEKYLVKARKDGDPAEFEISKLRDKPLSLDQFMKLRVGTKWEAIFSGLGDLRDIKFE
ncbi:MAG: zinc finger protein [Candidatus Riflebacteria bacterium]|nr:zinc finger protein [Candidatus Riflebacteria bacterium]